MNENNEKVISNVNSKGKEERNVPDLRFPNFNKKWNSRQFKDVFFFLTNNTLSRENLNYIGGKHKNIHYGDILTKYNTLKDINDEDVPYINANTAVKGEPLHSSDIIMADTAEDFIVGRAIEIFNVDNQIVYSGLHTIPLRPKMKFANGFLSLNINSLCFRKRVHPLIQGIKVYSLSKSSLLNCNLYFPEYDEQLKISNFILQLENRISTQKKIIEDYMSYKNWIVHQTFSDYGMLKEGNIIKLSSILVDGSKKAIDTSKYKKINVHLNLQGIDYVNTEREMVDKRPFYIRYTNEIIIGKQNFFNGSIAIIPEQYNGTICSNAIMSFTVKPQYDTNYVFYAISNTNFLRYHSHMANGTGQKELSEKDFLNFEIRIPDLAKQEKISKAINSIGAKIDNEKKILSLYEKQKQYLLNKMFI